jgi:hypothetical protein
MSGRAGNAAKLEEGDGEGEEVLSGQIFLST